MNKSNKPAPPASAAPQPTETPSELAPPSASHPVWRDADRTYHRVEQTAAVYNTASQAKIDHVKECLAADVEALAALMSISAETLMQTLRLSRATVKHKARAAQALSPDETERLLGVEMLIGKVATMVAQSGDPGGFDAAGWTARWLATPVPALGARTPGSFMDTVEGQRLVAGLLATTQSGAYA